MHKRKIWKFTPGSIRWRSQGHCKAVDKQEGRCSCTGRRVWKWILSSIKWRSWGHCKCYNFTVHISYTCILIPKLYLLTCHSYHAQWLFFTQLVSFFLIHSYFHLIYDLIRCNRLVLPCTSLFSTFAHLKYMHVSHICLCYSHITSSTLYIVFILHVWHKENVISFTSIITLWVWPGKP